MCGQLVREVLCELELPYLQRSCARGSPKRQELLEKVGHFQVRRQREGGVHFCKRKRERVCVCVCVRARACVFLCSCAPVRGVGRCQAGTRCMCSP